MSVTHEGVVTVDILQLGWGGSIWIDVDKLVLFLFIRNVLVHKEMSWSRSESLYERVRADSVADDKHIDKFVDIPLDKGLSALRSALHFCSPFDPWKNPARLI